MGPRAHSVLLGAALLAAACGGLQQGEGGAGTTLGPSSTLDLNYQWQPFTRDSVWNLKLSPARSETAIPRNALNTGPMDASDGPWGIKIYFAKPTDPILNLGYGSYNAYNDNWNPPYPLQIRGPANIQPPTGTDGTVLLIDQNKQLSYEMLQYSPSDSTSGYCNFMDVVDLTGNSIHRNVGVTAAGLPGIGGVLKAWETSHQVAIRHKLWVAANPDMMYPRAVWPAVSWDVDQPGQYAFLNYGDVIALSKNFNVDSNECNLSPFMKRIAHALQDYGGIVADTGGDALGFVSEVDSIRNYIDVDYNSTMWTVFDCLKQHMVKVNDPWVNATPGGLGSGSGTTTPPSVPGGLTGSPLSSTQVQLRWNASTGPNGVAGYQIFRDNQPVGTTTTRSFTDSGLSPGKTYSYAVAAYDAAGNQSANSAPISLTTGSGGGYPELLSNAGFEAGTAPWQLITWDGSPSISVVGSGAHSGSKALRIVNPDSISDGVAAFSGIPVVAGATYQASAWISLSGVRGGRAQLMIDWVNSAGNILQTIYSPGKAANSGWAQETWSVTAPQGATQAILYLYSYINGTALFDDASMKRTQ